MKTMKITSDDLPCDKRDNKHSCRPSYKALRDGGDPEPMIALLEEALLVTPKGGANGISNA